MLRQGTGAVGENEHKQQRNNDADTQRNASCGMSVSWY
jgi:hypothetical protein